MQHLFRPGFKLERKTETRGAMRGRIVEWEKVKSLEGILDLISGDSKEEANRMGIDSTHIFITDTMAIKFEDAKDHRLVYNGKAYLIDYVDNVMEMDHHLEIYLKYDGVVENENEEE